MHKTGPKLCFQQDLNPKFFLIRKEKTNPDICGITSQNLFWSPLHNQKVKAVLPLKHQRSSVPRSIIRIWHYPKTIHCSKCPSTVASCHTFLSNVACFTKGGPISTLNTSTIWIRRDILHVRRQQYCFQNPIGSKIPLKRKNEISSQPDWWYSRRWNDSSWANPKCILKHERWGLK